jgi:hypothetical protein
MCIVFFLSTIAFVVVVVSGGVGGVPFLLSFSGLKLVQLSRQKKKSVKNKTVVQEKKYVETRVSKRTLYFTSLYLTLSEMCEC